MSKQEASDILEKDGGWMTVKQVTEKASCNLNNVSSSLKKMSASGEIFKDQKEKITPRGRRLIYIYKWKD